MSKYDSTGRPVISADWDALSNIPELVDQIASLPDPGFDAFLVWDNAIDEIAALERLAENIPYDNGSSGLTATDVQAAIDEVAAGTIPYAGYIKGSLGASVTSVFNSIASTWTVAQQATGRFRITHSLGLSAVTDLAVTASARLSAGATDDRYCTVTNENANYFEVLVNDVGSGQVNDDFYFHAVRLV